MLRLAVTWMGANMQFFFAYRCSCLYMSLRVSASLEIAKTISYCRPPVLVHTLSIRT